MDKKAPDAFRTISEVADWLDTPAHVLRFWESKFAQVKPVKRAGGRRYYRPADMQLLGGIKRLLHDDGMTIKGVQKILREDGVKHVAGLSQALDHETDGPDGAIEGQAVAKTKPASKPKTPVPETADAAVDAAPKDEAPAKATEPAASPVEAAPADDAKAQPDPAPAPVSFDTPDLDDDPDDDAVPAVLRGQNLRGLAPASLAAQQASLRPLLNRLRDLRARMG